MMIGINNLQIYTFATSVLFLLLFIFGPQESINTKSVMTSQVEDPVAVVEMTNTMTFTPDTVKIKPGQTIEWRNTSLLVHSVTADPSQSTIEGSTKLPEEAQTFDSGMMDPEQTFKQTFEVPGTYKYFCIPHEGTRMYGWIIVSDD